MLFSGNINDHNWIINIYNEYKAYIGHSCRERNIEKIYPNPKIYFGTRVNVHEFSHTLKKDNFHPT